MIGMEAYMRMLKLVSIAVAVIWLSAIPARAEGAPWCVRYGTGLEGANCGFYSFEQCMAALSGNGGHCARNLFYTGTDKNSRRRQRD